MASWQQLADDLKTDPALTNLTTEQIGAVIDVLILTIHADEEVGFMEEMELEHQLFELPWMADKEVKVAAFIKQATAKAESVKSEDDFRKIISVAAARLTEPAVREKVFSMAVSLANIDYDINQAEHLTLLWLAEALEIADPKRLINGE